MSVSYSQNSIINGTVTGEGSVLRAATVTIAHKSVLTNSAGGFSIHVGPGSYTITITHVGYNKAKQAILIKSGETKSIQIELTKYEQVSESVLLGSRSTIQRSNLNTAVGVTRITTKQLSQTGQPSLLPMLNFTIPSLNVSRVSLFEPVTLRGVGTDHVLILVNGTRYHDPSVLDPGLIKGILGRGSAGNNLSAIPFSAIEKIEVLRDGASAQFGSDAIAGIMNIVLKKTTGNTHINLHLGQHYKGDGESVVLGINHGIQLNDKGFLNFSADFRYRNATHRGGEYLGTVYYNIPSNATTSVRDSIIALDNNKILQRGFSRKTPVSNDGGIASHNAGFLVNGGYSINSQFELFWTGTVNYRQPIYYGAYRFPKNKNQVNTVLYPDGFKQKSVIDNWDVSGIGGARGKTSREWIWEWNTVYGRNINHAYLKNTNNASQIAMGANAPTEFFQGSTIFMRQTNTLNLSKDFAQKIKGVKTFNIGMGVEYRSENYQTAAGEVASWTNYDTTGKTMGGSGRHPRDVVNENRRVFGLYTDIETDISDRFLINLAGRFENYNDFGSNLAGKLAMRYKLAPFMAMRGSVSNGYHAPSLQQIFFTSSSSGWKTINGVLVPVRLGTFNNISPEAKAFGIKPLQPEKAVNLSGGITSMVSPHLSWTIDAYWIQIKNRIVLSGVFDKSNPYVSVILQNQPDIDQGQFITNAINTLTRGMDIVVNGNWKIQKANLGFLLSANFNRTKVFGPIQTTDKLPADSLNTNTLFNREERERTENSQPASKIILSGNYKIGQVEFLIRNTRFGKTSVVYNPAKTSQDEVFSAKIVTDLSINYSPKTWLRVTAGVNNIFDVYPDPVQNILNKNEGITIYTHQAAPFGFNGGYYFLNLAFNF